MAPLLLKWYEEIPTDSEDNGVDTDIQDAHSEHSINGTGTQQSGEEFEGDAPTTASSSHVPNRFVWLSGKGWYRMTKT